MQNAVWDFQNSEYLKSDSDFTSSSETQGKETCEKDFKMMKNKNFKIPRRFRFDSYLNERKTLNLRGRLYHSRVASYISSQMIIRFLYLTLIHRALYCFPPNTPRRSTVIFRVTLLEMASRNGLSQISVPTDIDKNEIII